MNTPSNTLTTEDEKNIEDIQVGDWVIADDPTTPGEIEARQVLDTFVRHTDTLIDLYIDGEVISSTGEHPFWTPNQGWIEAKDLTIGSLLQTEDGRVIDVDRIEKREGEFTVYNFNVEGFHTYFVSDLGVLVHNANYRSNFLRSRPDLPQGWQVHHSLPQRYRGMLEAVGINVDDLQFLRGVPQRLHFQITAEWADFHHRMGGNPTVENIQDFAENIDQRYGDQMMWPGS